MSVPSSINFPVKLPTVKRGRQVFKCACLSASLVAVAFRKSGAFVGLLKGRQSHRACLYARRRRCRHFKLSFNLLMESALTLVVDQLLRLLF